MEQERNKKAYDQSGLGVAVRVDHLGQFVAQRHVKTEVGHFGRTIEAKHELVQFDRSKLLVHFVIKSGFRITKPIGKLQQE